MTTTTPKKPRKNNSLEQMIAGEGKKITLQDIEDARHLREMVERD